MATGFTQEQMQQFEAIVRRVVREEISDAGLRIDGPDHVDMAREDFRFLRKFRQSVEGVASKVGWAIITALVGGAIYLFTLGTNVWKGLGG
jgi:hypothetical protein